MLDNEVLREVATTKMVEEQWVMKFDGYSTANSRGAGVVLYRNDEETIALSFELEFPFSNNTA